MSRVARPAAPAWSQRPPLDLPAAAHKPVRVVLQELGSTRTGLTSGQAASRLGTVGRNVLASHRVTALGVLGRQLRNPLLVLLLAAAGVSAATGDPTDGAIIAAIVALRWGWASQRVPLGAGRRRPARQHPPSGPGLARRQPAAPGRG